MTQTIGTPVLSSDLEDFEHSLLLLPSSSGLSLSSRSLCLTILMVPTQHSKLRTVPPRNHVMVVRKCSTLIYVHFLPVKPDFLLSFWVTGTAWTGIFREHSVETVISLFELCSRKYAGFFLPGPGLVQAWRELICPLQALTQPLRVSLDFSPWGSGEALPPAKKIPDHLITWVFIAHFLPHTLYVKG